MNRTTWESQACQKGDLCLLLWTREMFISGRIRKQNSFQSEPRIHFSGESLALFTLSMWSSFGISRSIHVQKRVFKGFFNHQKLDCIPLTGEYTLSHRRYSVSWKMILTCWMRNEIKYIVIDYFWGMFSNSWSIHSITLVWVQRMKPAKSGATLQLRRQIWFSSCLHHWP